MQDETLANQASHVLCVKLLLMKTKLAYVSTG